MDAPYTFEPYDTAVDTNDQAQIDQVLREFELEAHFNAIGADFTSSNTNHEYYTHLPGYETFAEQVSPSGLESPGSMTTGSTNPSPLVPLLDYDLSFDTSFNLDDPQLIFPDLVAYPSNPGNMQDDWSAGGFRGVPDFDLWKYAWSTPCTENAARFPPPSEDLCRRTPAWNTLVMVDSPYHTNQDSALASSKSPVPSSASEPSSSTIQQRPHLLCPYCPTEFTDKTKLKIHTNKHIKPFRCSAAECDYSTAEKKSLQRHLLAKSKWDEEHRLAAQEYGLRDVKYRCPKDGCTYSTIREDNLKRHKTTCH